MASWVSALAAIVIATVAVIANLDEIGDFMLEEVEREPQTRIIGLLLPVVWIIVGFLLGSMVTFSAIMNGRAEARRSFGDRS